jgi:hypothetical protein
MGLPSYTSTCECEQYTLFYSVLLYQCSLLEYIYIFSGVMRDQYMTSVQKVVHINIYICPVVAVFYLENLKKRNLLANLTADRRIILKSNYGIRTGECRSPFIWQSHSELCIDTHTKQVWINMRPHDRTV